MLFCYIFVALAGGWVLWCDCGLGDADADENIPEHRLGLVSEGNSG